MAPTMRRTQTEISETAPRMTAAARVRREFRSGRPPKAGDALPLNPAVVWSKSIKALGDFRARMEEAGLNPNHARAHIVFIDEANPLVPILQSIESPDKSLEQTRAEVFERLASGSAIAIGMIFRQFDQDAVPGSGNHTCFPYQFTGLSEAGVFVLKIAALQIQASIAANKEVN
jgi:hypothetical protein